MTFFFCSFSLSVMRKVLCFLSHVHKEISLFRIWPFRFFFILHPAFSHPPNKIWCYRFFCLLFANCSECLIKTRFCLVIIISICDKKCFIFVLPTVENAFHKLSFVFVIMTSICDRRSSIAFFINFHPLRMLVKN